MAYTTIDNPELYFQAKLYTGTGTSTAFTLDGDENMQPDLVWLKYRNASDSHALYDSVRGTQEILQCDRNNAEITQTNGLSAFGSDSFTIGDNGQINTSSGLYVAWCWKEASGIFDIVGYTGNGTDDTDISHNLSAVPKMIIVKNRDAADAWQMYHAGNTSAPETDYMVLNTTAATADNADRWSDEAPTSSVFTLGDGAEVNTNTENYIAYCFRDVQGYSKFGSYTGNGNSDGVFCFTGFKPAMIIFKQYNTSGGQFYTYDNKRGQNELDDHLYPNLTSAEATGDNAIDILSNGFKMRSNNGDSNADAGTYIFCAWAESPLVNSNGVPCNAR